MARRFIPLGVFLALGLLLAVGLTLNPREIPSPLIDKPAPAFSLPQLHDPEATLGLSDLQGQVFMLNVWASWCVACRQEHPVLLALAETGQTKLYGLNYKDQPADALRWLDYYGNPYLSSAADVEGRTGIEFGVYGIPETFIIDQQGVIRYKHIGPLTEEEVQTTILPLITQLEGAAT